MARLKTTDKIDDVKNHINQLANQLKALENKHKKEIRTADTRRNILAGEMVIKYCKENPDDTFSVKFKSIIKECVRSQKDRALFGLKPLEDNEK